MESLISELCDYSRANGDYYVRYEDDEIFQIKEEHKTKIMEIIQIFKSEIIKIIESENMCVEKFKSIPVKTSNYCHFRNGECGCDIDIRGHEFRTDYNCECKVSQICVNGDELIIELVSNSRYNWTVNLIKIPALGCELYFDISWNHIFWGIYTKGKKRSISGDYDYLKKKYNIPNIVDLDISSISLFAIDIVSDIIMNPRKIFKPDTRACFAVW
jgi:hypothetical protein